MADELAVAIAAARAAGEVAMRYFRRGVPVETKADGTFVTQADRSCERTIRQMIQQHFPDDAFLGEEYGETEGGARRRWIIDPIDGTNNYVRGIPFFATLIALEEEGDVTAGVAFAPATGDLLAARRGGGATVNGQPAQVSRTARLAEASVGFGELKLFEQRGWWDRFPDLVRRAWRTRGFGDYLGHAQVIQGQADIMLDTGAPWDLAPLRLLVEEAGGKFTDLDGKPSIYSGAGVLSNGLVHQEVLDLLHRRR